MLLPAAAAAAGLAVAACLPGLGWQPRASLQSLALKLADGAAGRSVVGPVVDASLPCHCL